MAMRNEKIVETFTHLSTVTHWIIEECLSDGSSVYAVAINQCGESVRVECMDKKRAEDLAVLLSLQCYTI